MRMRTIVKIGNSYYVCVPKKLIEKFNWLDYLVDVEVGEDQIIIRKIRGVKLIRSGWKDLSTLQANVGEEDASES